MSKNRADAVFELESQFILRVPSVVSSELRDAVKQGNSNLKDRLNITLEGDNRAGTVKFDAWQLPSRVFDLPCVIESHKTLDKKTFYKTADIAQIMICYEPGEEPKSEDEAPLRKRKEAQTKKFLFPHGITPPLKNVRKRRFRRTLKKKYIDFPEIEKEVKRLFREDNEAESVRYEVIKAEDENKADASGRGAIEVTNHPGPEFGEAGSSFQGEKRADVGEHDLFGGALSSSEDEGDQLNINVDSTDDSRSPMKKGRDNDTKDFVTDFGEGLINADNIGDESNLSMPGPSERAYDEEAEAARALENDFSKDDEMPQNTALLERLSELEKELSRLADRRRAQEEDISNMENMALRQRFQSILQNIKLEEAEKQREYDNIVQLLHQE